MSMSSTPASGLSAPANPDDDLDAAVAGGPAFIKRMKALKEARAEHDAALADLRLGHDVVRAMQDVQVREQAVMNATANAEKDADEISRAASIRATDLTVAAKTKADEIITDAKTKADEQAKSTDELAAQVKEGYATLSAWSEKTKADANRAMDDVARARQNADNVMSEAKALMARAVTAHQAADARHAAIDEWLAKHKSWVDALPIMPP